MFWKSSKCKNCDTNIKFEWKWCPSCGFSLKKRDIFVDVERDIHRMEKELDMKIPTFMLKPGMHAKGIGITISSNNNSPPKIQVTPLGNRQHKHIHEKHVHRPVRIAKYTEEPEARIEKKNNVQIINLNLPDVKSVDDIEIRKFSQSIEVRAFAGDKGYFKLIPIPSNSTINNEFKDGVLKIQVAK